MVLTPRAVEGLYGRKMLYLTLSEEKFASLAMKWVKSNRRTQIRTILAPFLCKLFSTFLTLFDVDFDSLQDAKIKFGSNSRYLVENRIFLRPTRVFLV